MNLQISIYNKRVQIDEKSIDSDVYKIIEPMTIHDFTIESIPYQFQIQRNVMLKLRLKRCGRKQRAT